MAISFLKGVPALFIEREKLVVVGDIHIGIGEKYRNSGIEFPNDAERTGHEIMSICNNNDAAGIAMLGDVKDRISRLTVEDMRGMRDFFAQIADTDIYIAKGNHDAYIDAILSDIGVKATIKKEIVLSDVALIHGNSMPSEEAMKKNYLICGHSHMAALVNGIDRKAWLVARAGDNISKFYKKHNKNIKLVVAPAFNRLIIGSRIGYSSAKHLPLLNNNVFDLKKATVYDLFGNELA